MIEVAKKTAREKQLQVLLRIRTLQEGLAKGELAQANAATRTAYARLAHSRATYEREVTPPASSAAAAFRVHRAHTTAVAGMVRGAERDVESAEVAAGLAREKVSRARIKSQGLARLVEEVQRVAFAEMLAADQRGAEESSAGVRAKGTR